MEALFRGVSQLIFVALLIFTYYTVAKRKKRNTGLWVGISILLIALIGTFPKHALILGFVPLIILAKLPMYTECPRCHYKNPQKVTICINCKQELTAPISQSPAKPSKLLLLAWILWVLVAVVGSFAFPS